MELDDWQKEVLSTKGNIAIRSGRQVGKSVVVSKLAKRFAIENKNTITLVIAASQRQSSYIFEKITEEFIAEKRKGRNYMLKKPTLTKIVLKNGSKILCYPAGQTGITIRGLTIDMMIVDEADFINENVWQAVVPMIAVSRETRGFGWMILISTINPWKDPGFFKSCFDKDSGFQTWHISSEDCPRIPKLFLEREKERLANFEYQAEYCGNWVDNIIRYFSDELIDRCMDFSFYSIKEYNNNLKYYLGIDIAGIGKDKEAYVSGELSGKENIRIIDCRQLDQSTMRDTLKQTRWLDDRLKYRRIFIDSSGIGIGYEDVMKEIYGKRLIGLNNASKSKEKDERNKRILKEDLYSNTLRLMEQGKLHLIKSEEMKKSLQSIKMEEGKIHGKNAHLAEALVRMCWCVKEKGLKLFLA